ncbi:MAG: Holliday junction resolvase RuvX [Acidobacteriota bacterium]
MRFLGVDYGRKRIGLALSDATGTLARPWETIGAGATPAASARLVRSRVERFARETLGDEPIEAIVVGLPRRLNGTDNEQTAGARTFAAVLADVTGIPVHLQDERLTSHEAEMRLSEQERDWRARKEKLDAAAAAIILQDYLDAHASDAARDNASRST